MKNFFTTAVAAVALMGFVAISPAFAEDAKTETHQEKMMGGMDKHEMMNMKHECMEKHKDGKKCDHQMMESCGKKMKKEECMKMMDEGKKAEADKK